MTGRSARTSCSACCTSWTRVVASGDAFAWASNWSNRALCQSVWFAVLAEPKNVARYSPADG